MQVKDSYVIFDFCQTLCDFETADAFVEYVCEFENSKRIRLLNSIEGFIQKSGFIAFFDIYGHFAHYSLWKKLLLWKLKGISQKALESYAKNFYVERIRPHLICDTLNRVCVAKENNYKVAIVSASYNLILEYFAMEFGVDILVTNQLKFKNGVFTGKICDKDCIYKNKVRRFYDSVNQNNVLVVESYGDSKSDIPILSIAKQGYVISRSSHKKWVDQTSFKEIIWQ